MAGPLSGIRVVDLTAVVLGPYATQMLADFGAEVIKVEPPEGDLNRNLGPQKTALMSPIHLGVNRGKRSVTLDLKKPKARQALYRMVEGADCFVHSMRPKAARSLGISYDDIRKINRGIVYASALGFGTDGPNGDQAAFDDIMQAACGVAALMAETVGEPRYAPTIIADKSVGLAFGNAILAALLHRQRSGQGQQVEVPMFETMVGYIMVEHLWTKTTDPVDGKAGYPRVLAPSRKPYRTKDGWIGILPYSDAQWRRLAELIGRPGLLEEPEFRTLADRTRNVNELYGILERGVAGRTTREWLEICDANSIPAAPVNGLNDLFNDPHAKAVGLFQKMEHPTEGPMVTVRPAARFGATPLALGRPAPKLGQHTVEVLREAGLSETEIEEAMQ
ncbi:CaiB/BaiF CoA transferase family protein [Desertibaculum subflavum]|uniref:CaiB/BaiF CoA transferase family protein n=1 Tax=Desertibaculum subflavum TaxID=2268458 RepID=UPI000E661429